MFEYEGGEATRVRPLQLDEEGWEKLKKYLEEEHEHTLQERESMVVKWQLWWEQAMSRRKRSDAGPRDSNVDMSLTRERLYQSKARLQTPIWQQDPVMVAIPRHPGAEDFVDPLEEAMDWMVDVSELDVITDDWCEQFHIFPYGVIKTPFITQEKKVKAWDQIERPEYEASLENPEAVVTARPFDDGTSNYYAETEKSVKVKQGALPFVIPAPDFIFPSTAGDDPDDSPWVTHRYWETLPEVKHKIKRGVYNKKDPLTGDDVLEKIGNPEGEPDAIMEFHKEEKKEASEPQKQYEIMETYLYWDCEGDSEYHEIIVVWERHSCTILKHCYNFYHRYARPFVVHQYQKVHGSMYGIPLCYILEPVHVAYSASYNQRLDAASRANEVAIFLPKSHPAFDIIDSDGTLRGGVYENNGYTKEDIVTFNVSQPWTQLPELEQMLKEHADRLTSLGPTSFGEEVAERPTAQGTQQVIEEAKQPQYIMLNRFRKSFALIVKHMVARYQQYFPEGMKYYVQNETAEGLEVLMDVLQWPEEYFEEEIIIETKVASGQMSKSLRKQEVLALLERIPQVYEQIQMMAQGASDPQNPSAMISLKLLQGYQEVFNKFLMEFEVGKRGLLNPQDLITEVEVAQNIANTLIQMQQQIDQMGEQLESQEAQLAQAAQWLQAGSVNNGDVGPPEE